MTTKRYVIAWWLQWFIFTFPVVAWKRLRYCRHGHGAIYYGSCMRCSAPWFSDKELE